MSALVVSAYAEEPASPSAAFPSLSVHMNGSHVQPAVTLDSQNRPPVSDFRVLSRGYPTKAVSSSSRSPFESLPVEIVNQILSYLTHPRSRLPGLTETQSAHDFPKSEKSAIKRQEDLTKAPDSDRWAADLFQWSALCHPFHTLSQTSRRCNEFVEGFCAHKVRTCNRFNLPFPHLDKHGPTSVYPDLSGIVYRRLWLQHAPRLCIYCNVVLDCYPYHLVKRVVAACEDCFYRQTLTVDEVEKQYHIPADTILASPNIRGFPGSIWVLRVDVEGLALQLYGTRAFHDAHPEQRGKPCSICAITRFNPGQRLVKVRTSPRPERRPAIKKRKSKRFSRH